MKRTCVDYKSELTETDSNYENYLKIGGYMRLTFDFKFKKSIEKYRTPFQIYEYMTKNVKIPISKKMRILEEIMKLEYVSRNVQGFINLFEGKVDEINKDQDSVVINDFLKALLLTAMDRKKFSHVIRSIQNDNKLDYDNLVQKLLQSETTEVPKIDTVCPVKKVKCFKCNKFGHYANKCTFKKKEKHTIQ